MLAQFFQSWKDILTLKIITDLVKEPDGSDKYSLGRFMAIVQFYFMMLNPSLITTEQLILFSINLGYIAKDKIIEGISTLKNKNTNNSDNTGV